MGLNGHLRALVFLAGAAVLSACTTADAPRDPIGRSFTWFDYVAGGELRRTCGPGAPTRYRLVYNARFSEQVRTYDVTLRPTANGAARASVETVVWVPATWDRFRPSKPLSPWAPVTARAVLSEGDTRALENSLLVTGAVAPTPAGLRLPSLGFYWAVSSCRDGEFHFTAMRHPSPEFARFHPPAVMAWDRSGIPVNSPRPVLTNPPEAGHSRDGGLVDGHTPFTLVVGADGIDTAPFR